MRRTMGNRARGVKGLRHGTGDARMPTAICHRAHHVATPRLVARSCGKSQIIREVWLFCARRAATTRLTRPQWRRRRASRVNEVLTISDAFSAFVPIPVRNLASDPMRYCPCRRSPSRPCSTAMSRRRPRSASSSSPTIPTATASTAAWRPARPAASRSRPPIARSRDFAPGGLVPQGRPRRDHRRGAGQRPACRGDD